MRKRFHKGLGGFRKSTPLTNPPKAVYDVIAVNKKTGEIKPIDKATTVDEAKQLVQNREMDGFKFYFLENNTALIELV